MISEEMLSNEVLRQTAEKCTETTLLIAHKHTSFEKSYDFVLKLLLVQ